MKHPCSIEIEMSGLVDIEMSSFGTGSPTLMWKPATERGDAENERERSRSSGGAALGARWCPVLR